MSFLCLLVIWLPSTASAIAAAGDACTATAEADGSVTTTCLASSSVAAPKLTPSLQALSLLQTQKHLRATGHEKHLRVKDPQALCTDGKDNNGNDLIDCSDPWCKSHYAACQAPEEEAPETTGENEESLPPTPPEEEAPETLGENEESLP